MSAAIRNLITTENKGAPAIPAPILIGQNEIIRPAGYVLPGYKAVSVTIESYGHTITGFGEGPFDIAVQKAHSEAIERLALNLFCDSTGTKESSNGWGAHFSDELAIRSAVFELIERDVAVKAWENCGPFFVIPPAIWPSPVLEWRAQQSIRAEYFDLKILFSANENGACITALLFNSRENFVTGHASGYEMEDAILSAVNECMRSAHLAIRFEYIADVMALHAGKPTQRTEPGAHSLAYAYKETMPDCVAIADSSEAQILNLWRRHQIAFDKLDFSTFDVRLFKIGRHVAARVKSPRYQQIYWGRNSDLSKRNLNPHFVG